MKTTSGNVLVVVDETVTEQLASGLYQDVRFNPYHKINIYGTVLVAPEMGDKAPLAERFEGYPRRIYNRSKPYDGREFANTVIQRGDKIYFHYLTLTDEDNLVYQIGGKKVFRVRMSEIFCAIRDGQVHMNWNYVFGTPYTGSLIQPGDVEMENGVITQISVKPQVDIATLDHIGPGIFEQRPGLESGDVVLLTPDCEFLNTVEGQDFWVFKHEDILAIRRGEYIFPMSDYLLVQTDRTEYGGALLGIPNAHFLETPFTGTVVSVGPVASEQYKLTRAERILYVRKDMRMLLGNLILIRAANIQCHEQQEG